MYSILPKVTDIQTTNMTSVAFLLPGCLNIPIVPNSTVKVALAGILVLSLAFSVGITNKWGDNLTYMKMI